MLKGSGGIKFLDAPLSRGTVGAINASSGQSNASKNLIPQRVLTREFSATFKPSLLSKDAGIAGDVTRASSASTPLFALTEMLFKTTKLEVEADPDYTAALKLLERWAGVELRQS